MLHGKYGHDLNNCKVMLDQAQKMRTNWQTGKSGGSQNNHLYAKKKEDKELHALVQKMVNGAVKQQETKRKRAWSTLLLKCCRRMMTAMAMMNLTSSKVSTYASG